MRYQSVWLGMVAVACTVAVLGPVSALAQDDEGSWAVNRTPWGDPDLQGIWNSKTTTPLERPDTFEGREYLTDEEISTLEGDARRRFQEGDGAGLQDERGDRGTAVDVAGAYNSVFSSRGTTNPSISVTRWTCVSTATGITSIPLTVAAPGKVIMRTHIGPILGPDNSGNRFVPPDSSAPKAVSSSAASTGPPSMTAQIGSGLSSATSDSAIMRQALESWA